MFTPAAFRTVTPQFADPCKFSDPLIDAQHAMALEFVSENGGCYPEAWRAGAINLMTAHLLTLGDVIAQNNYTGQPGIVTSATIDKVAVTMQAPPTGTSEWRWWLNLTPYGAQLLALLSAKAAGGFYVGGLPERSAFRKVGGIF